MKKEKISYIILINLYNKEISVKEAHEKILSLFLPKKKVQSTDEEKALYNLLKADWELSYMNLKGIPYYFQPKDAIALKGIISKIKFMDADSDIQNSFRHLLRGIKSTNDAFMINNYSLPLINSKFNEICSQIVNGKVTNKSEQQSKLSDLDEYKKSLLGGV